MGVSPIWLAAATAALVVGGVVVPYVVAMLVTPSEDGSADGRPEPPQPNRPERPIPGEGRHDGG